MKKYEFTEAQINRLKANLSKGEDNVDDELITLTSDDLEPIDGEEGLEESKVIKLKESDITKLVKAVIEEQLMQKLSNLANKAGQAVKNTAGKVGEKLTNFSNPEKNHNNKQFLAKNRTEEILNKPEQSLLRLIKICLKKPVLVKLLVKTIMHLEHKQ